MCTWKWKHVSMCCTLTHMHAHDCKYYIMKSQWWKHENCIYCCSKCRKIYPELFFQNLQNSQYRTFKHNAIIWNSGYVISAFTIMKYIVINKACFWNLQINYWRQVSTEFMYLEDIFNRAPVKSHKMENNVKIWMEIWYFCLCGSCKYEMFLKLYFFLIFCDVLFVPCVVILPYLWATPWFIFFFFLRHC